MALWSPGRRRCVCAGRNGFPSFDLLLFAMVLSSGKSWKHPAPPRPNPPVVLPVGDSIEQSDVSTMILANGRDASSATERRAKRWREGKPGAGGLDRCLPPPVDQRLGREHHPSGFERPLQEVTSLQVEL